MSETDRHSLGGTWVCVSIYGNLPAFPNMLPLYTNSKVGGQKNIIDY